MTEESSVVVLWLASSMLVLLIPIALYVIVAVVFGVLLSKPAKGSKTR